MVLYFLIEPPVSLAAKHHLRLASRSPGELTASHEREEAYYLLRDRNIGFPETLFGRCRRALPKTIFSIFFFVLVIVVGGALEHVAEDVFEGDFLFGYGAAEEREIGKAVEDKFHPGVGGAGKAHTFYELQEGGDFAQLLLVLGIGRPPGKRKGIAGIEVINDRLVGIRLGAAAKLLGGGEVR
jgi:hypothetical protein